MDVDVLSADALNVSGVDEVRRSTAGYLARYTSKNTRDARQRGINHFTRWLAGHGIHQPAEVKRAHVDLWMREQEVDGAAAETIMSRVSSVAGWFGALVDDGIVVLNPTVGVRRPKVNHHEGKTVAAEDQQVARLMAWVADNGTLVERCYVGLLVELLLRRAEPGLLVGRDVKTTPSGTTMLYVAGKGGTRTWMTVSPGLGALLVEQASLVGDGGLLLTTATGLELDTYRAQALFRRVCAAAGVPELSPHQIRAWGITSALDDGAQLHDVQDLARHSVPEMTRRYDRSRGRRQAEVSSGLLARVGAAQAEAEAKARADRPAHEVLMARLVERMLG